MAATDQQTTADPPTGYADASIKRVTAENAIEYAYRDLGSDSFNRGIGVAGRRVGRRFLVCGCHERSFQRRTAS